MREFGCDRDVKSADECVAIEPALAQCRDHLAGGIFTATDESGDAQRFTQILQAYADAPKVTRERMYLETMQQIFANTAKVFMDSSNSGNLLYLPLDKLLQEGRARPAPDPGKGGASSSSEQPPAATPPASEISTGRGSLRSRDRDAGR